VIFLVLFDRIDFRFDVILWNFSNLSACFRLWLCLFLSTCTIVYNSFHFWAYKRLSLIPSADKPNKSATGLCKIPTSFSFLLNIFFSNIRFDLFNGILLLYWIIFIFSRTLYSRRKLSDCDTNYYSNRTSKNSYSFQ
jgi:hypothetical protein